MTEPTPSAAAPDPAGSPDFRVWHFATAVFDERTQELRVAGRLAELERKPTELLRHLLRHAGEVVTRDELLEAVWPGRIATEASLAKAVSRVRQELGDSEQTLIRTIHGYGYRLVAEVRIERPEMDRERTLPRRFNLHPGMAVPERPLWQLREHLASGGQGEVWLAEQPKSGERRVLKFAVDASGLLALKREITLYRLLREAVGPAARCVRLIDWNLETEPFFTESEHIGGGSFVDWAAARGGLAAVPLAVRLELLAQAAEALAAAHGVGVLHRDLKPANLLIDDGDPAAPQVRLADLGSGGLVEPAALDRYAITRVGLTQSLISSSDSGTLSYRAPELLAGQPATARADIHALGVMLYQCLVGDFVRPMAVGWEADINDPVLRADIAQAAAGNPALRLADAAEFAHRLRSLDARRAQWQDDEARRAAAEQQRLENQRLKARRFWLRATVAVLLTGLGASLWLYRSAEQARHRAEVAAETAEAVTAYFTDDLIDVAASNDAKMLTVDQLFVKLAEGADERLVGQPAVEARVRTALAFVLVYLSNADSQSAAQIRKAFDKVIELAATDPASAWRTLTGIVYSDFTRALSDDGVRQFASLLDRLEARLSSDPDFDRDALVALRIKLAFELGGYRNDALAGLRLLDGLRAGLVADSDNAFDERVVRAKLLSLTGKPRDAVALYRAMLPPAGQEDSWRGWLGLSYVKAELGAQLIDLGELDEAAAQLADYAELVGQTKLDDSMPAMKARFLIGQLRIAQGRSAEAAALLEPMLAQAHSRVANSWETLAPKLAENGSLLVDAALLAGRPAEALAASIQSLDDARLASQRTGDGGRTASATLVALRHADALIANGQLAPAHQTLDGLNAAALDAFGPDNLWRAERLRIEAGLALAEGNRALANDRLDAAEKMLLSVYTPQSWRLARLQALRERLAAAS